MKTMIDVLPDYLPKSMHYLITIISLKSLLILIKSRGGTRESIPNTAKSEHWLADLIGMDDFKKLAALYGGGMMDIPRCVKLLNLIRDIEILQDRRTRMPIKQLSLKHGMTERGISKALRRIEPYERQPWLKEIQASMAYH